MSIFPSKVNYTTGEVLTATEMNEIGQAINLLDGAQTSGAKNRVLNSNFSVWQRGTSIAVAAAAKTYTADRFWGARGGAVAGATVSRQATGDTTNLANIQYCARVQRDSGNTSTQYITLSTDFETVNSIPLAGKTVTFSFYARAGANFSAASNAFNFSVVTGTGTDQSISSGYTGQTTAFSGTATLTTTWQRFTFTGAIGATATQIGLQPYYTPVGTAGANDYFEITGVQLEVANTASPYAPNTSTYQAELAACQRYYYRNTGGNAYSTCAAGFGVTTTEASIIVTNPVQMRVTPTSADYSTLRVTEYVSYSGAVTSLTVSAESSPLVVRINAGVASGIVKGTPYALTNSNSTTAYFGLNAEL
jgi:hypothetical protein